MTLADLIASTDPKVSLAAGKVAGYRDALDAHLITKSEYEALVKSATDLDLVADIAGDIVRAELVKAAFNQILSIAMGQL